jgi:uncharacterized repeat protein (TIGR01451 family)
VRTATAVTVLATLWGPGAAYASPHLRGAPLLPLSYFRWGQAIAVGDFDGDGRADAAYGREITSGVALMRGDGAGGFHAPIVTETTPSALSSVVGLHAADLNGDGRLDLAQSDFTNGFFVFLGLGDGRFAQSGLGGGDFFVASSGLGDFDGDGRLDLALALWPGFGHPSRVLVYRGDGNGGFGSPVTTNVPSLVFAGEMGAADFDGDGRADLAVSDRGVNGRLTVLLGTASLALTLRGQFASNPAEALALGDADGDGRQDVALASTTGTATVLRGDGTGGFALATTVDAPPGANHVRLADLDGDGRLDLATTGANLWIRRGEGAFVFGPAARFGLSGAMAAGELTGDGRTDLLVGDSLLPGAAGLALEGQRAYPAGPAPRLAVADDFDRDGRPDLVVANANGSLNLLRGDGAGGFGLPAGALYGSDPTDLVARDFDRDGWPDVAAAFAGTRDVVVLRNDRQGGFVSRAFPVGGVPRLLAVGDFGGDGPDDIAVANETNGTIDVLHGHGDATFVAGGSTAVDGTLLALAPAHLNADGRLDLACNRSQSPSSNAVCVLVGTGLETFVPGPQPDVALGTFPRALLAQDLDGDGRTDLAGAADSQQSTLGGLGVHLGRGDGRFVAVRVQPAATAFALQTADVSLDGRADLAVLEYDGVIPDRVRLFLGQGDGRFAWAGEPGLPIGGRASGLLASDLDADGRPDLVAVVETANAVTVVRGRAPGASADLSVTIEAAPDPVAVGAPFHYRVAVLNQGPVAAEGVRLRFTMIPSLAVLASSPGSPACTAAGNVYTCDVATLASGASFVFDADVMVSPPPGVVGTPPELAGQIFAWAQVGALTPLDASPSDNRATSYVSVGPVDVALSISDSVDPVPPGGAFRYTLTVTNHGSYPATRVFVTTELPAGVSLVGVGPGCGTPPGHVDCFVQQLPPGGSASFDIDVQAATFTSVVLAASAWSESWESAPANNVDHEETSMALGLGAELAHGAVVRDSLPAGAPAQRTFALLVPPRASYEVVLDEASGDYGGPSGAALERLASNTSTVLQAGQAVGAGPARVLRWQNTTAEPQRQLVRVRSLDCATDCGADDVYRLRAYETTATLARFNTTGGQTTVVVVQNPGAGTVAGTLWFSEGDGTLAASRPFLLGPRGLLVLNVASFLPGRSGALTLTHDGGYSGLAAKAIALEPATGLSFDTVLRVRAR